MTVNKDTINKNNDSIISDSISTENIPNNKSKKKSLITDAEATEYLLKKLKRYPLENKL